MRTRGGYSAGTIEVSALPVPPPSVTVTINGHPGPLTYSPSALCPDLLQWEQIGEADGWRGRVVRGFFWLMRAWRPQ